MHFVKICFRAMPVFELSHKCIFRTEPCLCCVVFRSDAVDAKQRYKVSIRTGDRKGAGTDSDVSVILIGADGSSKETKLESHANNFERSKVSLGDHLGLI